MGLWKIHLGEDFTRFEFNSDRKKMSTILTGINDGERRIHIKGAAEIVVKSCTHYINKQGERNLMTKEMIFRLDEVMS